MTLYTVVSIYTGISILAVAYLLMGAWSQHSTERAVRTLQFLLMVAIGLLFWVGLSDWNHTQEILARV
ncbi:hypothetical protein EVC30_078 [Rhizobium phage RHph_Y1_11]|nr:hypothetical protein EVC30_078 [Rhizobium phage RHph_Y1_11]